MFRSLKTAVAVAAVLLVALGAARADAPTADDTARFLAGMMPSAGSPLMALTRDPAWQRHAKFFDSAFDQLEQRQISRVRAWSDLRSGVLPRLTTCLGPRTDAAGLEGMI